METLIMYKCVNKYVNKGLEANLRLVWWNETDGTEK